MRSILVIDDQTEVLKNTRQILEFEGYEALAAEDGLAGLEIAKHRQPTLIICDVAMPELDGFGFLEALKADPVTASIPVILISGIHDVAFVNRGRALGAVSYLFKPFTLHELLSHVNKALESTDRD
jgi:CheY-like chemotaxis protein